MSSKAHNKEGAYEFWNFVFDYNNYNDISKNITERFPTLKENEEDWKQEIMATDTYTDRYGKTYTPTDLESTMGGYECIIPPITNEEYDLFEKMLYSAEYVEPMPSKYYDIIDEELKAYILDKKSLDDTIKSIDNRVSNALNCRLYRTKML